MPSVRSVAFNKAKEATKMKQLEGLSRQQKRKYLRTASKKICQIKTIQNEFNQKIEFGKAKNHFKNLNRLYSDLESMGVIKPATKLQKLWGRIVSTFRYIFKRPLNANSI